jgi:hypothetical protein
MEHDENYETLSDLLRKLFLRVGRSGLQGIGQR